MRIPILIEKFKLHGYEMFLDLDGATLVVKPTRYPLIEGQKEILKKHKAEIINHLLKIN